MLEEAVYSWSECVMHATNKIFGKNKVFKGAKHWWRIQLDKLRKNTQKLRKKFRKRRTEEAFKLWKESDKRWRKEINLAKRISLSKLYNSINEGNNKLLFSEYRRYSTNPIIAMPHLQSKNSTGQIEMAQTTKPKAGLLVKNILTTSIYSRHYK